MNTRLILMGVAGCGKSSIGEALSRQTGIPYKDGDDLHPSANVEKMSLGLSLADDDRWPWLSLVAKALNADAPLIIGCSALKRSYRDAIRLGAGGPVQFVHLQGSRDLIAARMQQRTGHYMPLSLLDSQFEALEPPDAQEALAVSIDDSITAIVEKISTYIRGDTL